MRSFACAFGLLLSTAGVALADPPPAEVYGRLPSVGSVAISADGTKIIASVFSGDIQAVNVINLADGARLAGGRAPDGTALRGVGWAEDQIATFTISRAFKRSEVIPIGYVNPNAPLIVELERTGTLTLPDGKMQLMLADVESSQLNSTDFLFAPVDGDPGFGRMFAPTKVTADARFGVYRVDLHTGKSQLLTSFGRETWGVVLNSKAEAGARIAGMNDGTGWHIYVRDGDNERLLRDEKFDSGHSPEFSSLFLRDGRLVRSDAPGQRDRRVLNSVNPADNKDAVVVEDPKVDIWRVLTAPFVADKWSHTVVGAEWIAELGSEQRFFEPALESARTLLKTALGDYVKIVSWTRDYSKLVVFVQSTNDAGSFYLFDTTAKKLGLIAKTYPELPAANLGKVLSITYPARDGTKIPAYLTLPPGKDPKSLPTIILVHGGPQARDTADFNWWAQFLASRGYLVLQPNYRGSSGYGDKWRSDGYKEWGGLMQHDVDDGMDALVANGFSDPKRVCIVGASYGGYAALAGATLTPDRYTCAVSVAGLSDLLALMQGEVRDNGTEIGDLYAIGDPTKDREALIAASPIRHVADVHIPMLLMNGTNDSVVPPEQTKNMVSALQSAHKDVRYVELPGDDHWLSRAGTRTMMLAEIEEFLNEKMPVTAAERPVARSPIPIVSFAGEKMLESGGTSHPAADLFGPLVPQMKLPH